MKITVKNLGVLKQAEFSLGNLTIICGENNTGKTYATYALYGFLSLAGRISSINVSNSDVRHLLDYGSVEISLKAHIEKANKVLEEKCQEFTGLLPRVFASSDRFFKDTTFSVENESYESAIASPFKMTTGSAKTELFSISKEKNSEVVNVSLIVEKEKIKVETEIIKHIIGRALDDIIFGNLFPRPFIASAERTGAAIFRKELNFARNRLLEEMSSSDKKIDPFKLLTKSFSSYAMPVESNVDFTRSLEDISKRESFIAAKHGKILDEFANIIGGEYIVTKHDELYYVPKGKKIKLSMDESSSAVRSLLDIGFYLRHVAKPGDLLMIDEPELNLHPENQRRVARLFARLVNIGIKVFITTHSDYIIKELNTLILLNQEGKKFERIAEQYGYKKEELLQSSEIRVYVAKEDKILLDGGQRRVPCQTLVLADVRQDLGIEVTSFDDTLDKIHKIEEELIWGDEE